MPNFMPIFIAKILSADFLPNFKFTEFEHELELEPSDLGSNQWLLSIEKKFN